MAVYEREMSGSAISVIIGRRPYSRQGGEERLLPWSAHAQPLVVGHDAILVGNARHMLEIDQIAGVRAEEVPVGELGFHVFECAVDRVFAVSVWMTMVCRIDSR